PRSIPSYFIFSRNLLPAPNFQTHLLSRSATLENTGPDIRFKAVAPAAIEAPLLQITFLANKVSRVTI
ncbi:MAG: hypothetical protein AAGH40_12940, partial [Verrucomicrobiota bacterium]